MDAERISEALNGDVTPEEVKEVAESVGFAYVETGSKRQHQQYEPDEVKAGFAAPVPEDQSHEDVEAVLRELAWEEVERGHAEKKETYAREDD